MDRNNFNAIITRYLEKFDYTNGQGPEEWFKWCSINCFQQNWNIESDNLLETFKKSVAQCSVVLDGSYSTPAKGILSLLSVPEEVEFVRSAFRKLFAPGDLKQRDLQVAEFISSVNSRIQKYWPNDKYKPQTNRGTLCYLALAQPRQNYFYMYKRAKNWSIFTDFGWDMGSGGNFSLPIYYMMCDELVKEIGSSSALKECNDLRMRKAGVDFDDDYHTLAYDIMYCATTYHLFQDLPLYLPVDVKSRVQRRLEREQIDALKEKMIIAEKAQSEFETAGCLPPDLVGQEVSHAKFGVGIVSKQTDKGLSVNFDGKDIKFVFPDAFIQKHLSINDAEMAAIKASYDIKAKQDQLNKSFANAKESYEKAVAAFNTKWKRKVSNELIDENEE